MKLPYKTPVKWTPQIILLPLRLKHVWLFDVVILVCFGLLYAWYIHGTMVGRHAETGATLSENHVYPVGGVAYEARRWHSYALAQSGTNKRTCYFESQSVCGISLTRHLAFSSHIVYYITYTHQFKTQCYKFARLLTYKPPYAIPSSDLL